VNGSDVISAPQVNITLPLVVLGDLSIPNNSTTLVILYTGQPVLNISGEADLGGTLILVLADNVSLNNEEFIPLGYSANLTHTFASIVIENTNNPCLRYATGSVQQSPDSQSSPMFGVLIKSITDGCSRGSSWWIYVIAVIGALIVVVALVVAGFVMWRRRWPRWLWHEAKYDD